jgi:hypothetical protein
MCINRDCLFAATVFYMHKTGGIHIEKDRKLRLERPWNTKWTDQSTNENYMQDLWSVLLEHKHMYRVVTTMANG